MDIRHPKSLASRYQLMASVVSLPGVFGLSMLLAGDGTGAAIGSSTAELETGHCLTNAQGDSAEADYRRAMAEYRLPDVTLTAANGTPVRAVDALAAGRPVMLNFIFTSCNTICPILSATFAQVQAQLGPEAAQLRFVSISIDPEQDTPATLATYARRYGADGNWQFLTGDREDIITLQRAFDAYRGNKMSHQPLTFMRPRAGAAWLRIEGFPRAADLVREYRALISGQAATHTPADDA